jgi:hypothetical protein
MNRLFFALAALLVGCGAARAAGKAAELLSDGGSRELRKRPEGSPERSAAYPPLLVVALDGIDRSTLYGMLDRRELPALAGLLGPSAYRDDTFVATMPSSTMAAWTTAFTGVPPGEHGIAGNEFFIREVKKLGAPAPVGFADSAPTIAIYTDGYLDALRKSTPSVYERMRERDRDVLVWVAMHQIYSGADRLLLTKRSIVADAFEHALVKATASHARAARDAYAKLDEAVAESVVTALEKGPVPDVLTVYLAGADLYAHVASEGPNEARLTYLREVVDPALAKLRARLQQRGMLDDRWIVVTSDHGHTEILHDEQHALSEGAAGDPRALLERAKFRPRALKLDVEGDDDFDAVYTAGGATAYFYVADRSTCPQRKKACDWTRPPRWQEDVLPLAEALHAADREGALVPELRGTMDMILTRRPRPYAEIDAPFEVYVGAGRTVPVEPWLAEHPHPSYVDLATRLRDLATGSRGERAGDVMVLAHNGDRENPKDRYYFATPYHSWHGSASRGDSEIPLLVARTGVAAEAIAARVKRVLGAEPRQQKLTPLLLDLRYGQ